MKKTIILGIVAALAIVGATIALRQHEEPGSSEPTAPRTPVSSEVPFWFGPRQCNQPSTPAGTESAVDAATHTARAVRHSGFHAFFMIVLGVIPANTTRTHGL